MLDTKYESISFLDTFTISQEMSFSSHVTLCREAMGVLSFAQNEHPGSGGKECLMSSFHKLFFACATNHNYARTYNNTYELKTSNTQIIISLHAF